MSTYEEAQRILRERFGHDCPISLATVAGTHPHVRTVDGYYEDGAFYVVTYALSHKMRQIAENPEVALCGEWFTGHGIGENLGHVLDAGNAVMMTKLRAAFAAWYGAGHVDENDPHTCLLRVRMTDGVLMADGKRYDIDFVNRTA